MSFRDATDHYLDCISNLPPPAPEQQWVWARTIDRAQRGFIAAVSACPAAAQALLSYCREASLQGGSLRVVARCVLPQSVTAVESAALLMVCLEALEQGLACNDQLQMRLALQPLRLRNEFMAQFAASLSRQAAPSQAVRECLARITRRVVRINRAMTALVQDNQRLIVVLARHYRHSPLAFLDLIQEGNIGLMRAIERFNPEYGTRVSTYAVWWVRRAMVYAIARQSRDVRPSLVQYWSARQVLRTSDRLEREQGRRVTQHETARTMEISVAAVQEGVMILAAPIRLDAFISGTDDVTHVERLTANGATEPDSALAGGDRRRIVEMMLEHLPERQAKILRMRFGIGIRDDCTLEQIALQQGVTRERIRQIEAQALDSLRKLDSTWALRDAF